MTDLGARLKLAREDKGVSLRDIATRTKISVVALEALERNDFTRLPGGIFGRAFVRAYAVEIGLDPEETVTEFQVHLERSEREAAERGAIRVEISSDDREFLERQRKALRNLRLVGGVVLLLVLAIVGWQARSWLRPRSSGPSAPAPASSAPATPAMPAVAPPAPAGVAPPSGSSTIEPTTEPLALPASPAPVAGPPAAALTPAASEDGLVVDMEVTASCWIFAAADGVKRFSRLFRPGERERLIARRDVLLDVGNAGALEWTINGKKAKPLGREGVHVKTTVTRATIGEFVD